MDKVPILTPKLAPCRILRGGALTTGSHTRVRACLWPIDTHVCERTPHQDTPETLCINTRAGTAYGGPGGGGGLLISKVSLKMQGYLEYKDPHPPRTLQWSYGGLAGCRDTLYRGA